MPYGEGVFARDDEGATILRMPGAEQPELLGHTRTHDKGAVVDVKTWASDPTPACQCVGKCTAVRIQSGQWQCVKVKLPSTG
jgi:hypothetical protein